MIYKEKVLVAFSEVSLNLGWGCPLPSFYLDVDVTAGTLAAILDHGVTLAVEAVCAEQQHRSCLGLWHWGVDSVLDFHKREKYLVYKPLFFRSSLRTTKGNPCFYSPEEKDILEENNTLFSNGGPLPTDSQEVSRAGGGRLFLLKAGW